MNDKLYDITEVCKLLGTTSRALRFYEEKGIVQSTKSPFSLRRSYTEEQIGRIRRVMRLRALGLSVRTIAELRDEDASLKEAILLRRAELLASLGQRGKEISALDEVLSEIDAGENIFDIRLPSDYDTVEYEILSKKCAKYVVEGHTRALFSHIDSKLAEYMPPSVYERVRQDALRPLGEFVGYERGEHDPQYPNVFYHYLIYARLGLKIKFVFCKDRLGGLWFNYYEPCKREK